MEDKGEGTDEEATGVERGGSPSAALPLFLVAFLPDSKRYKKGGLELQTHPTRRKKPAD